MSGAALVPPPRNTKRYRVNGESVHQQRYVMRRVVEEDLDELEDVPRPLTRSECCDGPRPCPWVGCRYHLAFDLTEAGTIRWAWPDGIDSLEQHRHTCALDVADGGPRTLDYIARLLGVTRERVRQLEVAAMRKMVRRCPELAEILAGVEP